VDADGKNHRRVLSIKTYVANMAKPKLLIISTWWMVNNNITILDLSYKLTF